MEDKLPEIFDTIIIGAGPAGISAAIYAVRKNLKVLILTKDIGGQAAISGDIENYLGFSMISGGDLAKKFRAELLGFDPSAGSGFGLWLKEGVEVVDLSGADPKFSVKTSEPKEYFSETVIIATGRVPKMLNIPGEKEFLGKGVTICATCDAPFYKDKDVAIVGGGNSALDAAFALSKVAKSVTIINITDALRGDEILLKNVTSASNLKVLNNHQALEILGETTVVGIKIKDSSGKEDILPVSGIFIEIGYNPATNFDKLTNKNDRGEIKVDEFGATSIRGVYAAGDVNDLWGEQIVIAAGEGAKVALRVAEHISKVPHLATSNIHEQ